MLDLADFLGVRLSSWLLLLDMPYLYVEQFVALLNQENPADWTGCGVCGVLSGDRWRQSTLLLIFLRAKYGLKAVSSRIKLLRLKIKASGFYVIEVEILRIRDRSLSNSKCDPQSRRRATA